MKEMPLGDSVTIRRNGRTGRGFHWNESCGPGLNHEFNMERLKTPARAQTQCMIWLTGTHHVIFSVDFAMQQLGVKCMGNESTAWG